MWVRRVYTLSRDVTVTKDQASVSYPLLQFTDNGSNDSNGDGKPDNKPVGISLQNSTLSFSFLRVSGVNRALQEKPDFVVPSSTGAVLYNYCVLYRDTCLEPNDLVKQAVGANPTSPTPQQPAAVQQHDNYCVPGLGQEFCYSTVRVQNVRAAQPA